MTKKYPALDRFRVAAALLVVAVHVSPLFSINASADFILCRIIARVAVPFFFITTGYFLFSRISSGSHDCVHALIKKTAKLYLIAMLAYLPFNIYNGYFDNTALRFAADLVFDGTFYHLWYLPAVMLGSALAVLLYRKLGLRAALVISAVLYIIGLGGDSYYGIFTKIPAFKVFYDVLFGFVRYTRNGLFLAPIFILLGAVCRFIPVKLTKVKSAAGLAVSLALMLAEGLWLSHIGAQKHDSSYIALVPCMFFLFTLLKSFDGKADKQCRGVATAVYIIHPWVIAALWFASLLIGIDGVMSSYSLIFYLAVCAVSLGLSLLLVRFGKHKPEPSEKGRAWVEVDVSALHHNVSELKSRIPESCEIMAVVKANAYGLGAVPFSSALRDAGIRAFAVATAAEAVAMRRGGIEGELLVLGRTFKEDTPLLARYKLSQMVVDAEYARELNALGKKLRVHLAVDTGMRRLGIDARNIEEMESVCKCENLKIEGIATHLSCADSLEENDVDFTRLQIKRLFDAAEALKAKGYDVGRIHTQASAGIYNYPELDCSIARAGIALHGALASNAETRTVSQLKPVVSIRARVAQVRWIEAGESVSYGRTFTAETSVKIATVSIGYADGVPRHMSGRGGFCLLHGQRAPIAGRICMDLLVLDVTAIDNVVPGDVVTLLGFDGSEQIRCEDFAELSGTITNDILCRLGERLPRIYVNEKV